MATLDIATNVTASGTVDHAPPGSKYGITLVTGDIVPSKIITSYLTGVTTASLSALMKDSIVVTFLMTSILPTGYEISEFSWNSYNSWEPFTLATDFDFAQYLIEYNNASIDHATTVNLYVTYNVTVQNADTGTDATSSHVILFSLTE